MRIRLAPDLKAQLRARKYGGVSVLWLTKRLVKDILKHGLGNVPKKYRLTKLGETSQRVAYEFTVTSKSDDFRVFARHYTLYSVLEFSECGTHKDIPRIKNNLLKGSDELSEQEWVDLLVLEKLRGVLNHILSSDNTSGSEFIQKLIKEYDSKIGGGGIR